MNTSTEATPTEHAIQSTGKVSFESTTPAAQQTEIAKPTAQPLEVAKPTAQPLEVTKPNEGATTQSDRPSQTPAT